MERTSGLVALYHFHQKIYHRIQEIGNIQKKSPVTFWGKCFRDLSLLEGNFWIVIVFKIGSSVIYSNDSCPQCGGNSFIVRVIEKKSRILFLA